MAKQIIECVPNFSEGQDLTIINQITAAISNVEGVTLLDVDPGKATNRTVVTFVGEPENVIEAAYCAIKKAGELIDMSKHKGEHPRMGATDVCPLIPVSNITLEQTAEFAQKLAKRVGEEIKIPTYLYGYAQPNKSRNDLSVIRSGEYEGFFDKIEKPEWKPDHGPSKMNAQTGATVIGARDFLIAYNINLNTKSTRVANRIAFDVREAGRVKRTGNPYVGKIVRDEDGEAVKIPGTLKHVKAIGWYIEEYKVAQISMNLTNYIETPLHIAFNEVEKSATSRGVRITGSELVGLIPLKAMLDAGKYFLKKQGLSLGMNEEDIIHIAIKSLGLDELGEFDPNKKIIEYQLRNIEQEKLVRMSVKEFVNETAAESMAPGGGSVSALAGSMGIALGSMVANLCAAKRGWEDRTVEFSDWAEKAQIIKDKMLSLIDEDTASFNAIIAAIQMPKSSDEEKRVRKTAIQDASKYAAEVPFEVMKTASMSLPMLSHMVKKGNPTSITDAGVGLLCIKTAVEGAYFNVRINLQGIDDQEFNKNISAAAEKVFADAMHQADKSLLEVRKLL